MIDRVTAARGRRLYEVPVGFKWFVEGLLDGSIGFAGEESAGASFLARDGSPWSTDKDGIIAALLAAEITARQWGKIPEKFIAISESKYGASVYERIDAPANAAERAALAKLSASDVPVSDLAGEKIRADPDESAGRWQRRSAGIKVVVREWMVRGAAFGH